MPGIRPQGIRGWVKSSDQALLRELDRLLFVPWPADELLPAAPAASPGVPLLRGAGAALQRGQVRTRCPRPR